LADARAKHNENFKFLAAEVVKKFTFHSTAEEVARGADVKGKHVIVTGGNSGIGFETVRALAKFGAHVVFTTRDEKKAAIAEGEFKQAGVKAEGMVCCLDSFKSIRAFADAYIKKGYPLHILINNAGIMATPYSLTEEKFESQFGTNHMGHSLLTQLLLPILKKSAPARIINLSSGAHRLSDIIWDDPNFTKPGSYEPLKGYGQSKTANILYAKALNELLKKEKANVTAHAVHPGVIMTNLGRHILDAKSQTPPVVLTTMTALMARLRMKNMGQGAASTLVAALHAPYGDEGGYYFVDGNPAPVLPYAADLTKAAKLYELTDKWIANPASVPTATAATK